jgi:sulfur-carrier protein
MAMAGSATGVTCTDRLRRMPRIRLFAAAREAAGTGKDELPGATVAEVLAAASARYGDQFTAVLATCRVWVNGEPAEDGTAVAATDEVAVLPPVSGGALDRPLASPLDRLPCPRAAA